MTVRIRELEPGDAGYERIWLDSSRRFGKAHALYRRNGFVLLESLES